MKYVSDTSKIKTVTGQNLNSDLMGQIVPTTKKYPDVVELNGADTLFTYKGKGPVGTLNTYVKVKLLI